MNMKSIAVMLGFVAVALGPVPSALFPAMGMDAALAENNKSDSGGEKSTASKAETKAAAKENKANTKADKARAKADSKSKGKGGLASELKGLNAVKASPNALKNASPNSQVGRIAAYRDAAVATITAAGLLASATATRDALPVPTRTVEAIDLAISALDPASANYIDASAALELERQAAIKYNGAAAEAAAANAAVLTAKTTENTALLTASGGRELSAEAIAYIRDELDI